MRLQLLTAMLAVTAMACGGAESDGSTLAEHKAYTQEQFQKQQGTHSQTVSPGEGVDESMLCSARTCCTDRWFCCTWTSDSAPPTCG